ncbi:MAG: menaquinone biosynthesis protein [Euryarchaeota archaeon]|nr:menaquinone biosynthesis protein [Euryarchaeota archaeon]
MKIRIGKFGLLNNYLPYYRLERNGVRVIEALPKQLAEMFETGEIDFAPVPSFYYLQNKDKLRSYNFCVAAKHSVLSVIVISKEKMLAGNDGSIAVTNQTTTSVNLLKIILRERGLKNEVVRVDESRGSELLKQCTHALVIGDEAIKARMAYRVVMDLGEEWRELTGYPMVFGISTARKEQDLSEVNRTVMDSVEWGEENIDEIVTEAKRKFGMPVEFLEVYFKTLTYRMGAAEKRGLELFEEKCHEYGLL